MERLHAETRATVWGSETGWSLAPSSSIADASRTVPVSLSIEGDGGGGYLLVQSPDGFFTADEWFHTIDEALDYAQELYGVERDAWKVV
jgi:hypothetical protein